MPLTAGKVVSGTGSADCYEPFDTIFSVFETFPDVVPTKILELAAAQLELNGIDVAAISPAAAAFLTSATVRVISKRLLTFSLCQVLAIFICLFITLTDAFLCMFYKSHVSTCIYFE
jgi:hypothetical protein